MNFNIEDLSNEKREIKEITLSIFNGEEVGSARLTKLEKSKKYLLSLLKVKMEYRGKGYGSKLIEEVNRFLVKNNTTGILLNATFGAINNEHTIPFYARHGWKETDKNYGRWEYNVKS